MLVFVVVVFCNFLKNKGIVDFIRGSVISLFFSLSWVCLKVFQH